MSGYDPYGYDFPGAGSSRSYDGGPRQTNPYESFSNASVSAPPLITRSVRVAPPPKPKVGFNYTKNRTGGSKLLVLQEDMESGSSNMEPPPLPRPRSPLLSLNHSFKRPSAELPNDAKFRRQWSPERYPPESYPRISGPGTSFNTRPPPGNTAMFHSRDMRPHAHARLGPASRSFPVAKTSPAAKAQTRSVAKKHPAQAIKEKYLTAKYEVIGKNPRAPGLNRFIVSLKIPGENLATFIGSGPSERIATHEASYNAIVFLKPMGWQQLEDHVHDKVKDEILKVREFRSTLGVKKCLPDSGTEVGLIAWVNNVYKPYVQVTWKTEQLCNNRTHNIRIFKAELTVGTSTIVEVAATEGKAKELAAKTCIALFEAKPPSFMMTDLKVDLETGDLVNKDEEIGIRDRVMIKVNQLLWNKTKDIQSQSFVNTKNTAALILQDGDGEKPDDYTVVCVATGLGSLSEKKLVKDGTVVHDLHAEVLAIRAFRQYLFKQLEAAVEGEESVLAAVPDDEKRYALKPCYKLILFKNIPPPGDCFAITKPGTTKPDTTTKKIPQSKLLGCQRKPGSLQFLTDDGTYRTEDHFTKTSTPKPAIACPSDKLALTNFVGIQGGLLSQFINPIYIAKCYFGNAVYYCEESITRGMVERLEAGVYKVLPPYTINKPEISSYSRCVKSVQNHAPFAQQPHGGWALSDGDWEILKFPEGRAIPSDAEPVKPVRRECVDDVEYYQKKLDNAKKIQSLLGVSELAKRAMFQSYTGICRKLGKEVPETYFGCKALSYEYHSVKISAVNAFKKAELGTWPSKTVNTESFTLTDSDKEMLDLVKNY